MMLIDVGTGPPIVIVPGVQGRWEWLRPAVEALSAHCRVITFSLADEPTCGAPFEAARGFDCYVEQVRDAFDRAGLQRAAVCGVSYGGLIAAAFAARHPERVSALVLVSAIPPTWTADARVRFFLRAPRLLMPLFMLASLRMYKEIAAATPGFVNGLRAALAHASNVLTHMFSPSRMARRVRLLSSANLRDEVRTLAVPTLVITGDRALDRVVPVRSTEEYLALCSTAEHVTLARTGHLGSITRPDAFAAAVVRFVRQHAGHAADVRRTGTAAETGRSRRAG